MKRLIGAIALVLILAGCASTTEREKIDGVECMVHRNPFGKVTALSCNWEGPR